jgi:hypothetical protein
MTSPLFEITTSRFHSLCRALLGRSYSALFFPSSEERSFDALASHTGSGCAAVRIAAASGCNRGSSLICLHPSGTRAIVERHI